MRAEFEKWCRDHGYTNDSPYASFAWLAWQAARASRVAEPPREPTQEMSREALVATIAVWAQSDSGKEAIAQALRLAGVACDELTASRRVDWTMMNTPIGAPPAAPPAQAVAVPRERELLRRLMDWANNAIGESWKVHDLVNPPLFAEIDAWLAAPPAASPEQQQITRSADGMRTIAETKIPLVNAVSAPTVAAAREQTPEPLLPEDAECHATIRAQWKAEAIAEDADTWPISPFHESAFSAGWYARQWAGVHDRLSAQLGSPSTAAPDAEDAARYRWLRDHQGNNRVPHITQYPYCPKIDKARYPYWIDVGLDAAVDAARSAKPEPKP